jgi:hypothetical protein
LKASKDYSRKLSQVKGEKGRGIRAPFFW